MYIQKETKNSPHVFNGPSLPMDLCMDLLDMPLNSVFAYRLTISLILRNVQ